MKKHIWMNYIYIVTNNDSIYVVRKMHTCR